MNNKSTTPLLSPHPFKLWQVIALICLLTGMGYAVVRVFAAGAAATFLLPSATLTSGASVITNGAAIGGHMVVFGSASTPTPTPTPTPTSTPTPTPTPTPGPTTCPAYPGHPNA